LSRVLSRDAIEHRIAHHVGKAGEVCPSIRTKKITTHTLRHSAAMRLLLSGVDVTVIALWLGHEQVSTTNIYLHADMSQKERAIARTTPPNTTPGRYRASDTVLAFSKASDYADNIRPLTPSEQHILTKVGITPGSA
jgi:integrase/recombinase XerD